MERLLEDVVAALEFNGPQPPALLTHLRLGDGRMLVAGGLDDQPYGRWREAEIAGYANELLRKTKAPNFDWGKADLDEADYQLLDLIQAARVKLSARNHGKKR